MRQLCERCKWFLMKSAIAHIISRVNDLQMEKPGQNCFQPGSTPRNHLIL